MPTQLAERRGLTVSEDAARQDISNDLARLMRIGRQAAKVYVTDDAISGMADRIAAAVAGHQRAGAPDDPGGQEVVDLDTERCRRRR